MSLTKLSSFFRNFIIVLYLILTGILCHASLFHRFYESPFRESLRLSGETFLLLLTLAFVALFVFSAFRLFERLNEKGLRIVAVVLLLIMAGVFALFICNMRISPITDSRNCLDPGKYLAENPNTIVDSTNQYQDYFSRYSNNYFVTLLFMWMYRLFGALGWTDQFLPFYIVNAVTLYLGNVIGYLIVKEAAGRRAAVSALLLLVMNPLSYVLTFWVYTCSISIPMMLGLLWLGIRAYSTQKLPLALVYSAAAGILGALSYFIRPTSDIALIAFLCLALLLMVSRFRAIPKVLLCGVLCLLVMVGSYKVINGINDRYFSKELSDKTFPLTHWLMMGSHGEGKHDGEDVAYTASFPTKKEKQAANLQRFAENYQELGVFGVWDLYVTKMTKTFSDGYAQTAIRLRQDSVNGQLHEVVAGRYNLFLIFYAQAFRCLTLLLILWHGLHCLLQRKADALRLVLMLTTIGGILFYCLWEAKSSYCSPFIPVMLLSATIDSPILMDNLRKRTARVSTRSMLCAAAVFLAVWLGAWTLLTPTFCHTEVERLTYSLNHADHKHGKTPLPALKDDSVITQTFTATHNFNTICMFAPKQGIGHRSKYNLELLDESGAVLCKTVFSSNVPKSGYCTLTLPRVQKVTTPCRLTIRITPKTINEQTLLFRTHMLLALDQYEGDLTFNGKILPQQDLSLSVYLSKQAPYLSSRSYKAIGLSGTAFLILFMGWLIFNRSFPQKKEARP